MPPESRGVSPPGGGVACSVLGEGGTTSLTWPHPLGLLWLPPGPLGRGRSLEECLTAQASSLCGGEGPRLAWPRHPTQSQISPSLDPVGLGTGSSSRSGWCRDGCREVQGQRITAVRGRGVGLGAGLTRCCGLSGALAGSSGRDPPPAGGSWKGQ